MEKVVDSLHEDSGTYIIMLYKCAILGLALLLVGGYAYWRVYNETQGEQNLAPNAGPQNSLAPEEYLAKYGRWYNLTAEQQNQLVLELDAERKSKTPEQLTKEQQARLRADRDKLAAGQMNPGDIADYLYGQGWRNEVEQYKKSKEEKQITQMIAMVCLSIGGTVFGVCIVIGILRLMIRIFRRLRRRFSSEVDDSEPNAPEPTDLDREALIPLETENPEPPVQERPRQRRRVLALSEAAAESRSSPSGPTEPSTLDGLLSGAFDRSVSGGFLSLAGQPDAEAGAVATLMTDDQSAEKEWSAEAQWAAQVPLEPVAEVLPRSHKAVDEEAAAPVPMHEEKTSVAENTLKEQAEDLQKQIAAFKQVAQDVQQTTREHSEPLTSTLKELAQQVSAIRDYAASQQDRVEKLQDGYDWGIIRAFGLKVIRCLDNLEGRVARLSDEDNAVQHLEEIRDELLFALESSGIEQFRPEIDSDYRGQEKVAETLKEREPTQNPDQAGKIAKVIRPGYRYMIDDDNYKVVRAAQVKLFG